MAQKFEFRLQVQGPDISREGPIPSKIVTIGRTGGNVLALPRDEVSRQHAQLECTGPECWLTDLNSSNGTTVNGKKLSPRVPVRLAHGDTIRIGPYTLTFKQVELPEEPPPAFTDPQSMMEPPPPPAGSPPGPGDLPPVDLLAEPGNGLVPPGLSLRSRRLLHYLPGIYTTDFMARFLGIFEAILTPIEWTVDNFDLYLDPATAPTGFLPWLASWFEIAFEPGWTETQRRTFLKEAYRLYARRGTRWALSRVLEIHTGTLPEIIEAADQDRPHEFDVILRLPRANRVEPESIERIIDASKPAHTKYSLKISWLEQPR